MQKKLKAAIVSGTAIAVVGGGVAYAFWSTTGAGSGTGSTSSGASNLDIAQTSAITGLAPGVAAQTITGTVTNNATNNAYVNTVTVSIASVDGGAGSCDASDYTLASPTMTVAKDLAPGASTGFSGATIAFNNKATSQDGCKGATVHFSYASN